MGSGASTNIKHEVQELVEGKPVDVTDIKDFESALQEIAKYRKLAGEFLIHQSDNQERDPLDVAKSSPRSKRNIQMSTRNRAEIMGERFTERYTRETFVPKVVPKSDKVKDMLLSVVSKNLLFASYTKEEHMAIIDAFESVVYEVDDLVIQQGDNGDYFFIVETGYLDIYVNKKSVDGIGVKVGTQQGPESSFGELALMYNAPRAASIKAVTSCVLWRISRSDYKRIIIHSKFMRNKLYIELIQNVEVTGKRLGNYLTPDALEKLAISMEREVFNPNEVIIRQGNKGNNFYIIVEGEVNVYKTKTDSLHRKSVPSLGLIVSADGSIDNFEYNPKEELIATLNKGQYFGEKALLKEDVRQASCVCKTEVVCLTLARDDFIDMIGHIDELDKQLVTPTTRSDMVLGDKTQRRDSDSELFSERTVNSDRIATKEKAPTAHVSSQPDSKLVLNSASTPTLPPSKSDKPVAATGIGGSKTIHFSNEATISEGSARTRTKINLSTLKMMRIIGRGAFGHVKLASYTPPPLPSNSSNEQDEPPEVQYFAVKCQSKTSIIENGFKKNVLNEMQILLKLDHPFIARLYSAAQDDYYLYFVLELLPGGELFSYLQLVNLVSEYDAKFYTGAIVSAFTHIHQTHLRIAYRDLKPENIVLTAKGYPKLVDFGLAKHVALGKKTWTMCGTPDYLSPEIILNQGHDIAVDYWCLGIFICELVAGKAPFQADSTMETYENILNSQPRIPPFLSKNVTDIILKLLKTEQGKRLGNARDGIAGLVGHKWFGSFNWKRLESEQMYAPYVPKVTSPDDMSNFDDYEEELDHPTSSENSAPCGWNPKIDQYIH